MTNRLLTEHGWSEVVKITGKSLNATRPAQPISLLPFPQASPHCLAKIYKKKTSDTILW